MAAAWPGALERRSWPPDPNSGRGIWYFNTVSSLLLPCGTNSHAYRSQDISRARGGRMPGPEYYRVQAKVLLMLMLAMRDSKRAAKVEAKAREYLAQAEIPEGDAHELNALLEEYNNSQLRKRFPSKS
jgi:hypothetical protein